MLSRPHDAKGIKMIYSDALNQPRSESRGTPYGWFNVFFSDEIAAGEIKEVMVNGEQLVVYRDDTGQARAAQAHCPHLGANFAYGGVVSGSTIRCPFHGWQFDDKGSLAGVGDALCRPSKLLGKNLLKVFPVVETNRAIWVWQHPEGVSPRWEVPRIDELLSDDWTEPLLYETHVSANLQDLIENGVDAAHFPVVHRTGEQPNWEFEFKEHVLNGFQETLFDTAKGPVRSRLALTIMGPGLGIGRFSGLCNVLLIGSYLPISEDRVRVRFLLIQPKVQAEKSNIGKVFIESLKKQMEEDILIWEHKIYKSHPPLSHMDGPITRYRRWFAQFLSRNVEVLDRSGIA